MDIVAGIVLYNPEIKRLNDNLKAILPQVSEVVLYDNGSKNIKDIKNILSQYKSKCKLLLSNENRGIAHALNEIAKYSLEHRYKWLLTLDQDSVCYNNIITTYQKYLNLSCVGQLCCRNIDRNIKKQKKKPYTSQYREVNQCITSGSLIKLSALKEVGGFDESLFIDWVDVEICYALRTKGYKNYEINFVGILHELGNPTPITFLMFKTYTYNYSPFRDFYSSRNSLLVTRRYFGKKATIKRIIIQLLMISRILFYEQNSYQKISAVIKGMDEGITRPTRRKTFL